MVGVGGGGGWGARGKEYTNLKRSTLLKDTNPPFRDLDDNQIEELPPGVFDNNTELAILWVDNIYAYVDNDAQWVTYCLMSDAWWV